MLVYDRVCMSMRGCVDDLPGGPSSGIRISRFGE